MTISFNTEDENMGTVIEQPEAKPASRSAIAAYRQSVRDAVLDETIADAAGKSPYDWQNDRRRWEAWQRAAATLASVPELQAAADKAEAEAEAAATIPGSMTFDQAAALLEATKPIVTPDEWMQAMRMIANRAAVLKSKAATARQAVTQNAITAEQTLRQLSKGAVAGDGAVTRIGEQIQQVQDRMLSRHHTTFNVDDRVRTARAQLAGIASGEITPPASPMEPFPTFGATANRVRALYFAAKEKLGQLLAVQAGAGAEAVAAQKDQAELKRLQGEAVKAHQAALLKLGDPANFRWDDE
jgi:hypothetical protein